MKFFGLVFLYLISFDVISDVYVGKVSGLYVGKSPNKYFLSKLSVDERGVITNLSEISEEEVKDSMISLKTSNKWDVIYPGLIDLHGHPKQNVLPLWDNARGQFANRHEWRDWSVYSHEVSGNMNPWPKDFYTLSHCAAFR